MNVLPCEYWETLMSHSELFEILLSDIVLLFVQLTSIPHLADESIVLFRTVVNSDWNRRQIPEPLLFCNVLLQIMLWMQLPTEIP
ncbi:MAG: hypothetical protein BA869_02395 [Desulfuromonadales bacterium C00003107]|nr:MAG: hypothetical protein BA869_02395 [Desulfuromonadales bacterium C00003107]